MTKPVIAAVNGHPRRCIKHSRDSHRRKRSSFSQSFVKIGLHPDWGGTYFLPHLVTPNKACEMFFLGEAIDAAEALRSGDNNRVVSRAGLAEATQEPAAAQRFTHFNSGGSIPSILVRRPNSKRCCATRPKRSCVALNRKTVAKVRAFWQNARHCLPEISRELRAVFL